MLIGLVSVTATVQYLYMKDILGRLLPAVEHEIDARFRARFESFAWDGTNSFSGSTEDKIVAAKLATMGKQHSTYMSRFASAENLLQGLNSFLIEKQIDEKEQKEHPSGSSKNNANITTAAKITTMHEKAKGVTRESVLEKIIMSMSDRLVQLSMVFRLHFSLTVNVASNTSPSYYRRRIQRSGRGRICRI